MFTDASGVAQSSEADSKAEGVAQSSDADSKAEGPDTAGSD